MVPFGIDPDDDYLCPHGRERDCGECNFQRMRDLRQALHGYRPCDLAKIDPPLVALWYPWYRAGCRYAWVDNRWQEVDPRAVSERRAAARRGE